MYYKCRRVDAVLRYVSSEPNVTRGKITSQTCVSCLPPLWPSGQEFLATQRRWIVFCEVRTEFIYVM
jgi:hypothetical protein